MVKYNNNNNEIDQRNNRRITNLEETNPWLLNNRTNEDLERQSTLLSNNYVEKHLRGVDSMHSRDIKRDLESYYSVKDETLQRYTICKI
jgi:hypothetical protein